VPDFSPFRDFNFDPFDPRLSSDALGVASVATEAVVPMLVSLVAEVESEEEPQPVAAKARQAGAAIITNTLSARRIIRRLQKGMKWAPSAGRP